MISIHTHTQGDIEESYSSLFRSGALQKLYGVVVSPGLKSTRIQFLDDGIASEVHNGSINKDIKENVVRVSSESIKTRTTVSESWYQLMLDTILRGEQRATAKHS